MVFEITAEGTFTTVYNFCSQPNCDDGSEPIGGVIEGADGNFFGATYTGRGYGTIYELTRSGTLTSRYTFCRQMPYCTDGYEPTGFLVQGADGNFYGTTVQGGIPGPCLPGFYSCGTVFELTTTGTRITLHDFCSEAGCADGLWPYAGLVQGTDGNFYGETYYGGTSNNGTVFKLSTGLGPFVKTLPTFGTVGANAIILGNNLTGASSVTFNGVPTKFQVESDTAIRAVVPSAATSGPVQVVTPGGTLTSNVVFRVLP